MIAADFGEPVTGIGYQFFSATALLGSRVTTGISNVIGGIYTADATPPTGAIGVRWDAGDMVAVKVFAADVDLTGISTEIAAVKAKTDQLAFSGGKVEAAVTGIDIGEVEFVFPETESAQLAYIFSRISAVPGTVEDGVLIFPPLASVDLQAVGAIVLQGVDPVPQPEAILRATLVSSAPTVTFRGAIMGSRVFEAKTQPNGAVILQLPRNSDITPSGSQWKIEVIAAGQTVFNQTMTVGSTPINLGTLVS